MLDAIASRIWAEAHHDLSRDVATAAAHIRRGLGALRPRLDCRERERVGVALLVSVPVAIGFVSAAIGPAVA